MVQYKIWVAIEQYTYDESGDVEDYEDVATAGAGVFDTYEEAVELMDQMLNVAGTTR